MAKFSSQSIEGLEYDFTSIPHKSGEGYCKGRGLVPEPTEEGQKEYVRRLKEITGAESVRSDHIESALDSVEAEPGEADDRIGRLKELLADFCKGSPSKEQLEQLPYRYFMGFVKWLSQEINDPEVKSAATRR